MLKAVFALLAALRQEKELSVDDILVVVSRVKSAWMRAMSDVEYYVDFAGGKLHEQVDIHSVGLLAARERLSLLVQKIGAMKHEVMQLFAIDQMPRAMKAKLGEALRTLDASSQVKADGWEGWLQYALMYRRVSVTTDPTFTYVCPHCTGGGCYRCSYKGSWIVKVREYFNYQGRCVPCGGNGFRTKRVKLSKPIVHKLARDMDDPRGLVCKKGIIGVQHVEVETHKTKRVKCRRCKGEGVSAVQNKKPMPLPFDLIDMIELAGIMQALDHYTDGQEGGIRGHFLKEQDLPSHAGAGISECGDLHERMHHNALMDIFSRENEPGGDINTCSDDREEEDGPWSWEKFGIDTIMPDDIIRFDKERKFKFGTKAPILFTKGGYWRGDLELNQVFPWSLTDTDEPTWFDNYGRGGILQELITDRIYVGDYAFDPEFHSYRARKNKLNYTTGQWNIPDYCNHFATIYIKIDAEIRACLHDIKEDVEIIKVTIKGDMVTDLKHRSATPAPTHTITFEMHDGDYHAKMPVAHRQDDKWVICEHVASKPYRRKLAVMLDTLVITEDQVGQLTGSNLLPNLTLAVARERNYGDGKAVYYPGHTAEDETGLMFPGKEPKKVWIKTGPKYTRK